MLECAAGPQPGLGSMCRTGSLSAAFQMASYVELEAQALVKFGVRSLRPGRWTWLETGVATATTAESSGRLSRESVAPSPDGSWHLPPWAFLSCRGVPIGAGGGLAAAGNAQLEGQPEVRSGILLGQNLRP
jgi:hypothetical protein